MWIAWKSCLFVQHSIQMNCRRICLHRHNKPTMVCGDVWYSCKDLKKLYLTIVVGVFYVAPVFYLPDPFKHDMFFNVDMGQRSIWSNLVESSAYRSSLQQVLFGIKLLLMFMNSHRFLLSCGYLISRVSILSPKLKKLGFHSFHFNKPFRFLPWCVMVLPVQNLQIMPRWIWLIHLVMWTSPARCGAHCSENAKV